MRLEGTGKVYLAKPVWALVNLFKVEGHGRVSYQYSIIEKSIFISETAS